MFHHLRETRSRRPNYKAKCYSIQKTTLDLHLSEVDGFIIARVGNHADDGHQGHLKSDLGVITLSMRCNNFSFKCKKHFLVFFLLLRSFWLTIYNPLIVRNLLNGAMRLYFTCQSVS